MIWWDWGWRRKLALVAAMVGASGALTLLTVRSVHEPLDWRAVAGGISFFTIPQLMAWSIFVAVRTGAIQMKGRYARADQPFDFWFRVTGCCLVLAMYVYVAAVMATS